jgi:hypothetical protein
MPAAAGAPHRLGITTALNEVVLLYRGVLQPVVVALHFSSTQQLATFRMAALTAAAAAAVAAGEGQQVSARVAGLGGASNEAQHVSLCVPGHAQSVLPERHHQQQQQLQQQRSSGQQAQLV